MFALQQSVKVRSVNCRAELHGDKHVPAIDIGKLVSLIQSEADIELDPPTPEQQADMLIAKTKKASEGAEVE